MHFNIALGRVVVDYRLVLKTCYAKYSESHERQCIGTDYTYKHEIVWKNVLGFLIIHVLGGYGGFLLLSGALSYKTILYCGDTDADPHNSNRGFFFSHMGWLMTKKHPYVIELGRKVDMSDLLADPYILSLHLTWLVNSLAHFYGTRPYDK
ncbi:Acyl-CoA desaturase BmorQPVE3 [Operophtera brumata]|uniref:Acyl-CoA desaturase BmorQPVE3 n=1 Tax=Operophtera brumata TaxID=104452 RepID=A0A0L7L360_OPEBR|nr:Acyl-CoA desaturase BmorQPVE3 [Operophtera brumata]